MSHSEWLMWPSEPMTNGRYDPLQVLMTHFIHDYYIIMTYLKYWWYIWPLTHLTADPFYQWSIWPMTHLTTDPFDWWSICWPMTYLAVDSFDQWPIWPLTHLIDDTFMTHLQHWWPVWSLTWWLFAISVFSWQHSYVNRWARDSVAWFYLTLLFNLLLCLSLTYSNVSFSAVWYFVF